MDKNLVDILEKGNYTTKKVCGETQIISSKNRWVGIYNEDKNPQIRIMREGMDIKYGIEHIQETLNFLDFLEENKTPYHLPDQSEEIDNFKVDIKIRKESLEKLKKFEEDIKKRQELLRRIKEYHNKNFNQ